jgi:glutathione S-transferase
MAEVKIYTSRNCGWAVRNYASLLEKGVEFDTIPAVDGSGIKTDEFLSTTPFRMTPVLVHGETCVFESALINEYINDEFPNPPLLPADPAGRIEARKWIHFGESRILSTLTLIARLDDIQAQRVAIGELGAGISWFDANVLRDEWRGPYLFGEMFSLTDIAFHTVFETLRKMEEMLGATIVASHPSMDLWQHNIAERPSIRQAVQIRERLSF